MIFLYIGLGLVTLYVAFCVIATHFIYKANFMGRGDGNLHVLYTYSYPDLDIEKFTFKNQNEATLCGFIYKKKGYTKEFKSLVIIQHGIGGGHHYLLPTIQYLTNRGYLVVGYDQYGCCMSEGPHMDGLCQGIIDFKCLYKYIKSQPELAKYKIDVFSHSWGAFAVGASLCDKEIEINHVLLACGFDNDASLFEGINKFAYVFSWAIYLRNFIKFGKVAFYSISKGLKTNRKSRIFYIQGSHDNVVNPEYAGRRFEKIAEKYENVNVLMVENKGHAPYVTRKSQQGQDELLAHLGITTGKHVPYNEVFYYDDYSEIDENIYSQILNFYEK